MQSEQVKTLLSQIDDAKVAVSHDESYNNTATKRLDKLNVALSFAELNDPNIAINSDDVVIDGRFIATLSGKRWRVKGKGVWYRYSDPAELVRKVRNSS